MSVGAHGAACAAARRGIRRGVYLLPSLFTMANMFCGYCCIVFAMRDEFHTAAPLIGLAIVLDMLDGRIARLTGSTSEFGLQFDSLADVISFGVAPAILAFEWGLSPFDKLGWATGFIFVSAAAIRLARFNIQTVGAGRPALLRRHAEPCRRRRHRRHRLRVPVRPARLAARRWRSPMVLVPALLMVSTIRYRSFKTLDLQSRRSYRHLIPIVARDRRDHDAPAGDAGHAGLRLPRVGLRRARVDEAAAPRTPCAASRRDCARGHARRGCRAAVVRRAVRRARGLRHRRPGAPRAART